MVWYIVSALVAALITIVAYAYNFFYKLGYGLSNETSVWANFSSYVGGILGPILSFLSLVLLIRSLDLQRAANNELREQIRKTDLNERHKSFENHLFNMISLQSQFLDSFHLYLYHDGQQLKFDGAHAIIKLEFIVCAITEAQVDDSFISEYIEEIDQLDKIYSSLRSFHIMIKAIDEKLSDANGFNSTLRMEYYKTIINYTDFSLLRLIMMGAQFMDCYPVDYLKNNKEFKSTIEGLGLSFNLYNRN
ncbi:hypothetical protein [Vibrio metschnikovii]|uniref:hypothetical protein n=1 Tax=Vibrio metschnikovii TaxID=28172 RepID=UPI00165E8E96|nr:hypothetical protein [Vibrio metschnikovii]